MFSQFSLSPFFENDFGSYKSLKNFYMEVPGMSSDDISAEIENGYLTLSGSKSHELLGNINFKKKVFVGGIDHDKLKISVKNGILAVNIESEEPKKIPIKVS